MVAPPGTCRHQTGSGPLASITQRKHKSAPVIKVVRVQATTLVSTDVANFRALVQEMTGNIVASKSGMRLLETKSVGTDTAECNPNPKRKGDAQSHCETLATQKSQARMCCPTSRLPALLQHPQRSRRSERVRLTAASESAHLCYMQSVLPEVLSDVKGESDAGDNGSTADAGYLQNADGEEEVECESRETSTCDMPRYIAAGDGPSYADEDLVDRFFADGDSNGDYDEQRQVYEALATSTTCRYPNSGSGSSIGNVCRSPYSNYFASLNYSWRTPYEVPGGFDYF